ncbi:MAG: glutamate--tRNA ligase [Pelagibacteraceae bacterium]|nr:glutamate--tRNA ligase [Pelagibacteraceae bacterium]|tara:strand:- start:13755 stop:15155 length:1401 start_codon:yes stop_codon:yes gene_type:complete
MTKLITRFAPSPTGPLHLGGLRTALINYILSKQDKSSKFYIRIEDTDKKRSEKKFTDEIINGLKWIGLNWDSEIQIQSKRISRHQEIANILLSQKNAYKCICTENTLKEKRERIKLNKVNKKKLCTTCKNDDKIQLSDNNYVVRIHIPDNGSTKIKDNIKGDISINNLEMDDFILIRQNGEPTYMLSVVVDDFDLGVNSIVRGDDHFYNTFRQYYIYKYMNWPLPEYSHIPLIHGEDGAKLSKRHGAVNLLELKNKGYLPEAIINNLILLGWSPNKGNYEFVNLQEIIKKFKITDISKSSSIFSYEKLNFFNNYYLRKNEKLDYFLSYCKENDNLIKYYNEDKEKLIKIFNLYKKQLNYYEEIIKIIPIYFDKNFKFLKIEEFNKIFNNKIQDFKNDLDEIKVWDKKNLSEFIDNYLVKNNIKFPEFGKPLRNILINSLSGPSLSDILDILGKKDTIERLNQYIVD